jgi:glycosyltransferase involved in cell wall biosynthesis
MLVNRLKREGKKVVLTVHEVFPHRPFLGGRIDKAVMRKMYGNADLLIVHTESLKRKLIHLYSISPQKVRVIRHGYFMGARASTDAGSLKQRYHVPPVKRVLLFFGTIRENKGLDILLRAMQELKSAYFLLIAGDTAGSSEMPAEHYKRMIEMTGLSDAVHWVKKYVSSEEAADIFTIADAVILPYRKSFHAQSGVLNLAVGYEKPCVVSDVGGIGETVREYNLGVVVRAEDPAALISGITRLFTDGTVSCGFKRYKRENSWQEVARRLIIEYEAETASMP